MGYAANFFERLLDPLRVVFDAQERVSWPYLLGGCLFAVAVLGLRRAWPELHRGLLRRELWWSVSSRTDLRLIAVKALLSLVLRVPWAAATLATTLWIGLRLHAVLGPAPDLVWPRGGVGLLYTVVLFVVWDFSRYFVHRLMHTIPWLWSFHQVHHSATVLTPLTLYRTHPVETLLYDARGWLTTSFVAGVFLYLFRGTAVQFEILGVHALGFAFNLLGANLRHSHVWLRFGVWERWFISPAQHQLHHGRTRAMMSCNYGTWLALWDRRAGTWRPAPVARVDEVGLEHANHRPDRVSSLLLGPLLDAGKLLSRRRKVVGAALALVVAVTSVRAQAAPTAPRTPASSSPGPAAPPSTPAERVPTSAPVPTAPPDASSPPAPPDAPAVPQPPPPAPEDAPAPRPPAPPEAGGTNADGTAPAPAPGTTPAPGTAPAPAPEGGPSDTADGTTPTPEDGDEEFELSELEPGTTTPAADDPGASELTIDTVAVEGVAEAMSDVPGSVQIIDEEELERRENDDVHRVLRAVPGVYVREEDGFGLRPNIGMRGVNSDRSAKVTLMEDGVLLGPAPYSAPAAYYFPLMTRVASVRVYKGPGSIVFGPSTVGGAIDLRTRAIPTKMSGYIDAAGGMRGYVKGHGYWGTSTKHFGILLEGAHVQSNGFKQLDGGGNTGFDKSEFMIKGRYNVDPGRRVYHQVDVKLGFARERSAETYLGLTDADFEDNPYRRYAASANDDMTWWRTQGELRYFVSRGNLVDFEVVGYRHDFDRAWNKFNRFAGQNLGLSPHDITTFPSGRNGTLQQVLSGAADSLNLPSAFDETLLVGTNDRRFVSQGIATVLHVRPRWRWLEQDIEFGARLHHDSIRRLHTEVGYLMRSGVLVPDTDYAAAFGSEVTTAHNRHSATAGAFHLVDTIKISRVTLTPGARVEVIGTKAVDRLQDVTEENLQAAFVPGMGLHVRTTRWLGLFAGVHSGFSPVAPGQPESIDPERSINYELGGRVLDRRKRSETKAEAIGFFNDYYNLTFNCSQSRGCTEDMLDRQFEGGRAFIYGAELSASQWVSNQKGSFWFDARASYTFTGTQFRSSFVSADPLLGQVRKGDEVPYLPQHIAALALGVGGKIWLAEFAGAYVGDMRDLAGSGRIATNERIPRHFVVDFNTHVSVTRRAKLYLSINNLLNTPYMVSRRPYGARPGMPLQLMAGFKYEIQRS